MGFSSWFFGVEKSKPRYNADNVKSIDLDAVAAKAQKDFGWTKPYTKVMESEYRQFLLL